MTIYIYALQTCRKIYLHVRNVPVISKLKTSKQTNKNKTHAKREYRAQSLIMLITFETKNNNLNLTNKIFKKTHPHTQNS